MRGEIDRQRERIGEVDGVDRRLLRATARLAGEAQDLFDEGLERARGLLGLVVFVGLPEELLFRGMIQEGFTRITNSRFAWIVASVIFGVAHVFKPTGLLPEQRHELLGLNWRYGLLATVAGLGYGWVYRRTGKVSAAALTHGLVDWLWSGFFGR